MTVYFTVSISYYLIYLPLFFGLYFTFCFFFLQKKPKGQEYYLGYFGQYKPTKGQGKNLFEFATNLGNVNLTKNYGTLF